MDGKIKGNGQDLEEEKHTIVYYRPTNVSSYLFVI